MRDAIYVNDAHVKLFQKFEEGQWTKEDEALPYFNECWSIHMNTLER